MAEQTIRVLALMETHCVSGPARNLIEFARSAMQPEPGYPAVEISIAAFRRGAVGEPFIAACREAGVRIYALEERRRFDGSVVRQLRALIDELQPDVVQTHNIKSNALVRWMGAWRARPWVVFQHGYTARDWKDRLYTQVDRWSVRRAFRVVAVCGAFARSMERLGVPADRIVVQHNSVADFPPPPPAAAAALRARWAIPEDAGLVLAVGRLSAEKGHADLLRAIALLRRERRDFRLLLAGEGSERTALEQLTRSLNLEGVVTLAGYQSDVKPYYAAGDVLALPSHSEGSPNVVLEAMVRGLAVAATTVGGVPEIIHDGDNGLLVPPRDPAAMARALERLLGDETLRRRLGSAGREYVLREHSPQTVRRRLRAFYGDVSRAHQRESPRMRVATA